MNNIILWGATGQSIVLEEFLGQIGYNIIAIIDNNERIKSPFPQIPIFYGKDGFHQWKSKQNREEIYFIVAIGGGKGKDRMEIHSFLKNEGLIPMNAIHPTSFIANSVKLGIGCQILANSTICARTVIEDNVIINTTASIDHECVIGKGVHIAPGAKLAGCVDVGENSFIGTGAIVLPNICIGMNVTIGAGSIVTKNIPNNKIVYGNPAKIKRTKYE